MTVRKKSVQNTHCKRLKDKSVAPEARRGTCQKYSQAPKRREQHSTRLLNSGYAGHHKTGGKSVCSGHRSKYAYGQHEGLFNSAELETMRIVKNPTTVITANGEVLTKEEATVICQRIGLIRDSVAS